MGYAGYLSVDDHEGYESTQSGDDCWWFMVKLESENIMYIGKKNILAYWKMLEF